MTKFFIISPLLFFLPLYYSLETQQIFSVNKFIYILFFIGIFSLLFLSKIFDTTKNGENRKNMKNKIDISSSGFSSFISSSFLFFSSLFVCSLLASSFFSITPIESFFGSSARHFGSFFLLLLFSLFLLFKFFHFTQKQWIYGIFFPILCGGICSSIWAISQNFGYSPIFGEILNTQALSERSFAGMGQPNFLAQTLLLPFFISIYFSLKSKNLFFRLFSLLSSAILFFLAFYSTSSRAGMFGIVTGLCILLGYFAYKKYSKKYLLYIGIFFAFSSFLFLWLLIFFWGNEISFFLGGRGQSIESRYYFWNESLPLLQTYWSLGVGGDLLQSYLSPMLSMQAFATENFSAIPDRTHSFILDFFLHFGILPISIFFIGFFFTVKKSIKNIFSTDEKNKNISLSLFLLAGIIGTFSSWMFGFPVLVDSFFVVIAIAYIFSRNNISEKIKISFVSKIIISIFLICFSFFLFSLSYIIYQSEKSLFILTQENTRKNLTDEENRKNSENILATPYLSDNIIQSIPFISSHQQKKVLEIGKKYHYNSLQWNQIMILKYIMDGNIPKARKYFLYTKHILGNHFPQQWKLLQSISQSNIFSPKDIQKFHQDIKNMIPKEYLKLNEKYNAKIKKFWKHHSEIMKEIFNEDEENNISIKRK